MPKLSTGDWTILSHGICLVLEPTLIVRVVLSTDTTAYSPSAIGKCLCIVSTCCVCARQMNGKDST